MDSDPSMMNVFCEKNAEQTSRTLFWYVQALAMHIIRKKRKSVIHLPSSSVLPLWHLPYTAKEQVVLCRRCKRESAAATLYNLLKNRLETVFSKAGVQPLHLEPWYFAEDEQRSP